MLSLSKAQDMKKAGLRWTPQPGDLYSPADVPGEVFVCDGNVIPSPDDVWFPRLDQLLAEIEKRGWSWDIRIIKPLQGYCCEVWRIGVGNYKCCDAEIPEDAAADALLLWILTEGGLPMGD